MHSINSRGSMRSAQSFAMAATEAVEANGGGGTLGSKFLQSGGASSSSSSSSSSSFDAESVPTMLVRTGRLEAETARDIDVLAAAVDAELAKIRGAFVERRSRNGGYLVDDNRPPRPGRRHYRGALRTKQGKVKWKGGGDGKEEGGEKKKGKHREGQSIDMTIRVPVESFFALVDGLKGRRGGGEVEAVAGIFTPDEVAESSDEAQDVTSSYVDAVSPSTASISCVRSIRIHSRLCCCPSRNLPTFLNANLLTRSDSPSLPPSQAARAATLRGAHARLLSLMAAAKDVDAVLRVQRELTSTTQQLEAKEAALARLSKGAALSTLRLTIRQAPPDPTDDDVSHSV